MIHQPSKYHHPHQHHSNPLTHFLSLHSSPSASPMGHLDTSGSIKNGQDEEEIDVDSLHKEEGQDENTDLDVVSGSMGKSFTIAAILGLKKNVAVAAAAALASINDSNNNQHPGNYKNTNVNYPNGYTHQQHLQNQRHFNDVMNLSMNQSLMSLKPPHSFDGLGRMNGGYSGQGSFLPASFQHPPPNGPSSALQNLQKLHQQHVSNTNPISVSNGFRILNRPNSDSKSSSSKSSMKSKRVRTIFTPEQLERLEAEFERQQYMVGPERLYLAHTLQLTEAQVKVWFQNRRIKWRKHHLELTQQRLAILRQRQLPANSVMGHMQENSPQGSMGGHPQQSSNMDEIAMSPESRESCSSHEDQASTG